MSYPLRMFTAVPFGEYEDEEFHPVGVLRVETESSIWFVCSDRYQRLPAARSVLVSPSAASTGD